jgi:CubicO group peptidase (beta-lactamase class C family)
MGTLVSLLAILGALFVVAAPLVAYWPQAAAQVSAWMRRDRDRAWVPRRQTLGARLLAATLFVLGVLLLVAVQPRVFRMPALMHLPSAEEPSMTTVAGLHELMARVGGPLVESGRCVGLVVGVVDASGARVQALGQTRLGGRAVDGSAVFEIGAVTQVFTGRIYQRLVAQGVVTPDRPLRELLPDSMVSVPAFGDQPILLDHLATHRSGLPRTPPAFGSSLLDALPPFADPWGHYRLADLFGFFSSTTLERAPGARAEVSDLGIGVLGLALERAAHADFDSLVRREIGEPLGLKDTRVVVMPDMRKRLARGYVMGWGTPRSWRWGGALRLASPARPSRPGVLPGAMALRSTADDLLALLSHELGLAARAETKVRRGWLASATRSSSEPMVWQHGAAGGCRSWIGMSEARRVGVVVLANSALDLDPIGEAVLEAVIAAQPETESWEEVPAPEALEEVEMAPADSAAAPPP